MTIIEIKYLQFTGSVTNPIVTGRVSIQNRTGIIVRLRTAKKSIGYGEASPLPNFSRESLTDVIKAIKSLQIIIDERGALKSQELLASVKHLPSLIFALEAAIHSIELRESGSKIAETEIEMNEVIGLEDTKATLNKIHIALQNGITTIKVKIGRSNFEEDLLLIHAITKKYPDITLRLDVNGGWALIEALDNIKLLHNNNIEYIEQPVADFDNLLELARVSSIPIAPDESIFNYREAMLAVENANICFIVIKPSMFGFNNTIKLIDAASRNNVSITISSLYESAVGKSANLYLASLCKRKTSHGLLPSVKINGMKLTNPFDLQNGKMKFGQNIYPPDPYFENEFV